MKKTGLLDMCVCSAVIPSAPVLPGTVGLGKVVVGKQSSLHRNQVTFLRSTAIF